MDVFTGGRGGTQGERGGLVKDVPCFWALNANKAPYLPAQQGPGCRTALAGPGEGLSGRAWLPSGKASAGILNTLQSTKQLGNFTGIIKTLSSQVKNQNFFHNSKWTERVQSPAETPSLRLPEHTSS